MNAPAPEPTITDDLRQIREQLTDVFERVKEKEGPSHPTRNNISSSLAYVTDAIFNSEIEGY